MKISVIAVLILCVVPAMAEEEKQSDLESYIEGIRASGISEMGRNQVYSVAAICCGSTVLTYRSDEASGRFWPSYTSATCPKPEADPPEIERWKELKVSETDLLVPRLKPFADTDGSGFVTTEEASDFRYLIEYGYLAQQVAQDQGANAKFLAKASGQDPKDAMDRLATYKELARKIIDSGVAELPYPEFAESAEGSD